MVTTLATIIATLGTVLLIKGFFILIFQKHALSLATKMLKKPKNLRRFAIWEVIIALLILIIATFL